MKMKFGTDKLCKHLLWFCIVISPLVTAHNVGDSEKIRRQLLSSNPLPNVPGYTLTSIIVELQPGAIAPAHKHDGFVYAYVLQGRVRSQLNDNDIIEYSAGDVWTEPPAVIHTLTENASDTDIARLLVVFVAKDNAKLTRPAPKSITQYKLMQDFRYLHQYDKTALLLNISRLIANYLNRYIKTAQLKTV